MKLGIKARAFSPAPVALMLLFANSIAGATDSYFEQYGYEDEINRCISLLRPSLGAASNDRVTYEIQEIDLRGPWYRFEISASVVDVTGQMKLDAFKVGCKANRWVETAQLMERPNAQQLALNSELFASK
jgi:hypothetical protein